MKNYVQPIAVGVIAGLALLGTEKAFASEVKVQDFTKTVTKNIPHTETICNVVEVPIYGSTSNGASAGDVLGGMIIGGLLGKGVTGNDKGAAAGAVIGGMVSADKKQGNQQIVGYRQENRCQNKTTYTTQSSEVYSHSVVEFFHEGRFYRVQFNKVTGQ